MSNYLIPDDSTLLQYVEDDGLKVEPYHYVHILPMVLVME